MKKKTVICLLLIFINLALGQNENGIYAVIKSNKGRFTAKLYYEKAPLSVANFIALAEGKHPKKKGIKFYNNYSISNNCCAQSYYSFGLPYTSKTKYTAEEKFQDNIGFTIRDEHIEGLKIKYGSIAFNNIGLNTSSSGFIIINSSMIKNDISSEFNFFGEIIENLEVPIKFSMFGGTEIKEIMIKRIGIEAENFDEMKILND